MVGNSKLCSDSDKVRKDSATPDPEEFAVEFLNLLFWDRATHVMPCRIAGRSKLPHGDR